MDPFFVNEEDKQKKSFRSAFKFGHHAFAGATFKN